MTKLGRRNLKAKEDLFWNMIRNTIEEIRVVDDEYNNRSLCWTDVCMQDSGKLIYSADHDSVKTNPCDDFPTFAMGEFLKHRVPNERYAKLGFRNDVDTQFFEKQKRILNGRLEPDAPQIFKVVKNFFKKCISSDSIIKSGPADMLSYMKRLNLPLTSGAEWDEANFNIQSLFNFDPELAFSLFFDLNVVRCNYGDDLCGYAVESWKINSNTRNDTNNILQPLKVDKKAKNEAVEDFVQFLESKLPVEDKYWIENLPYLDQPLVIDEDHEPKQSWRRINRNYLLHLGFNSSKMLGQHYPKTGLVSGLSEIFLKLDQKRIANIFAVAFIHKYQKAFIVYSFTKHEENLYGTKRSHQRFEQCVQFLETNMKIALDGLIAQKLFDKSVQAAAIAMVQEAIEDFELKGESFYDKYFKEIGSIKLAIMFPDEITNVTNIIDAYTQLKLDGAESFVEMYIEMDRFKKPLEVFEQKDLPDDESGDQLYTTETFTENTKNENTTVEDETTTMHAENDAEVTEVVEDRGEEYTLTVPVKWTLYPSFHPNRPRFFNTASFYREVLRIIHQAVYKQVSPIDLAYKNYARWLDKGNQDLHLPAFKLTSRQMFWLSIAHVSIDKYQRNVSQNFELAHQLTNKYMHVILKHKKAFRDDFQCGEMTERETQLYEEFQTKLRHIENVLNLREFCGNCHMDDNHFNNLRRSGLFEFVESILTDPMYEADLNTMNNLLKENRRTNANLAKVFSSVCPEVEGCKVLL